LVNRPIIREYKFPKMAGFPYSMAKLTGLISLPFIGAIKVPDFRRIFFLVSG
jgi:hypothetical protein